MRHRVLLWGNGGRVLDWFGVLSAALLLTVLPQQRAVRAAAFLPTTTPAEWVQDNNWDTNSTPNAVGATAVFNAATTAFQTVTIASDVTVGSITFDTNTAFPTSLGAANAGDGRLILDAAGAGPVTILSTGTGNFGSSGSNTNSIAATMVFNDDVVIDVQNTVAHASTGGFRLGGPITGLGGLTKNGPGLMTWAFTPGQTGLFKDYQGPTILNGGRVRMSSGAAPRNTSSFTINAGGQLDPISSATYTLGSNLATLPTLNLNGFGATTGPFAAFPGAIRPDTNLVVTIANNVVLQSDAMLHSQGSASGTINLNGTVSGRGILFAGAGSHDANVGKIVLKNTNSYTSGTVVNVGTLVADSASVNAFGFGAVQVVSANTVFGGSQARVQIVPGATDAIADGAYLNLAGGGTPGIADDGYIDLGDSSVNETLAGLMLGGIIQPAGTYGSNSSTATFKNDEYFSGSGIITVTGATVPGDYNNNGVVDAADQVLWRKGGPLANDFTPGVQASDYDFWRARFAATTNPGSGSGIGTAAVPEPSTIALVGCVTSLFAIGRGRRRATASCGETNALFSN